MFIVTNCLKVPRPVQIDG